MAYIILKNGREFYTNDNLEDWENLNEKPQFISIEATEVSRSKGLGDDIYQERKVIINKDEISEINP